MVVSTQFKIHVVELGVDGWAGVRAGEAVECRLTLPYPLHEKARPAGAIYNTMLVVAFRPHLTHERCTMGSIICWMLSEPRKDQDARGYTRQSSIQSGCWGSLILP